MLAVALITGKDCVLHTEQGWSGLHAVFLWPNWLPPAPILVESHRPCCSPLHHPLNIPGSSEDVDMAALASLQSSFAGLSLKAAPARGRQQPFVSNGTVQRLAMKSKKSFQVEVRPTMHSPGRAQLGGC